MLRTHHLVPHASKKFEGFGPGHILRYIVIKFIYSFIVGKADMVVGTASPTAQDFMQLLS